MNGYEMKWYKYIIILLLFIPIATAEDICRSTLDIGDNCTMLTPFIVCTTYDYVMYNTTTNVTPTMPLTLVKDGIYKFNVNGSVEGYYIFKLCNNVTREISVYDTDEDQTMIAMVLLIGGFGALLIGGGIYLLTRKAAAEQTENETY